MARIAPPRHTHKYPRIQHPALARRVSPSGARKKQGCRGAGAGKELRASLRRGRSLAASGGTEGALRRFEAAVEIAPGDAEAHHERADMLARQEKFQEAYDSCARSAEIEPRAQTCANMAMALTNLHGLRNPGAERRRRATDPADRAIGTGEGYAYAHFVKAYLLLAAGREPETKERIARAVSLDPGFARDSTGEHLRAGR